MIKNLTKGIAAVMLFMTPHISGAQVITLGTASEFVIYTTVGAVTNSGTGFNTHLTGKVGSNSGSSTGFGNVDGSMHSGDPVTSAAAASLLTAYNQLNSATPTFFPSSTLGNGSTLVPGVYSITGPATLNGTLTLDGLGNPGSVFIFQINGAFSTTANAKVNLINGALACNVYWKTEGLVSVGSGSTMRGTIVANNAAISMGTLDTLEGRLLSLNGAITLNSLTARTPIGCGSPVLSGPVAPTLGSVGNFALFSSIGPVSNSGATSYVTGDIGTNLGLTTGYNPLFVNGTIHSVPNGTTAAAATALTAVHAHLHALPTDIELLYPAIFGHKLVLTPHTYLLNAATSLTDTLYLNAQGNSDAVFVIKINGMLSAISGSVVKLINGTQTKNVYWKVEGAVSLGNNSVFHGNVIANNGAIDITSGVKFFGRALTTTGAVTTSGDSINAPVLPSAGTISGNSVVCVGSSIQLTATEPGGTWSVTNPRASVSNTGLVTGISDGLDTVMYTVTNAFGTETTTKIITVSQSPPNAGTISGPSSVCTGSAITLTNPIAGGIWNSSNATATVINGVVTGVSSGIDTITYTVSNTCGTGEAMKVITINPVTDMTAIANQTACSGVQTAAISFAASVTGTNFAWSNNNTAIGLAATGTGNIPSFTAQNNTNAPLVATITVTPATSSCQGATRTFTITVNNNPTAPVISLTTPASVCNMTYFRNFGAATLPPAGVSYGWTANNAAISDVGNTQQYALVNFKSPGKATVTLTAKIINTGCMNTASYDVDVTSNVADVPAPVTYFNKSFICLQNREEAYSWGYDDANTLAPTMLKGEMNQDYVNATPDFNANNYWVMVTHNGCIQKTYYNKPEDAQMKPAADEVKLFPNPASNEITVAVSSASTDDLRMEIYSMLGQKMHASSKAATTMVVDISSYPPGVYMVISYLNKEKIITRFVKN